jgi:hypothetical protein
MYKVVEETITTSYLYLEKNGRLVKYWEIIEYINKNKRILRKQIAQPPLNEGDTNYIEDKYKDTLFSLLLDSDTKLSSQNILTKLQTILLESNLPAADLLAVTENYLHNILDKKPYTVPDNWASMTDYERYPERYLDDLYKTQDGVVSLDEKDSSLFNMVVNTEQ